MTTTPTPAAPKIKNPVVRAATLGVGALAIMNVTAVVSLRGLPAEATYGLTSVFYYLFAAVFFLIPVSIVAAELATAWPQKGGVFRWVGEAFGPLWGFVAIFLLWVESTIWFPTALTFASVSLAFVGPNLKWDEAVAANRIYTLVLVLLVYWLATFATLQGLKSAARLAKWGGMVGTIIPAGILIALGVVYMMSGKPLQMEFAWKDLVPNFSNFNNLVLAAGIFLAFAGMEMNAIHVNELDDPTRNYPMAIGIASLLTVAMSVFGTLAIGVIIPAAKIDVTQSLLLGFDDLFAVFGLAWASPIMAIALAFGVLGGVTVWVAGPSAGIATVGRAGYLPPFFQKMNKNGMAINILIMQGLLVTFLSVMFVVLPSVQAAYQILSQLTVTLYLIMYVMMFAAAIFLRFSQPNTPRPYKVPFGSAGMWIFGGVGLIGSLIAFVLSFVPPSQIAVGSPTAYVAFLIGGNVFFVLIPIVIYAIRKPHWRTVEGTESFEPFTWEREGRHPGTEQGTTPVPAAAPVAATASSTPGTSAARVAPTNH